MRVASLLLGFCWLIFFAVWVVKSLNVKQPADTNVAGKRWIFILLLLVGTGLILKRVAGGAQSSWLYAPLWRFDEARAVLAVAVSYAGLAISLWARTVLGRNWSARPELKLEHELVTRGPYARVRHPIYTGLLLMFAAIALLWPTPAALLLLPVVVAGIHLKLAREEVLMAAQFPNEWPSYRERTSRVIPLLW